MYYIQVFYLKNERLAHSLLVSDVSKPLRSLTKMSDMSELLRPLTKNERPWAIPSGLSPKMSNREWFTQVAHQKWATMSKSLRSLTKSKRMRESLVFYSKWAIRSFFRKPMKSNEWIPNPDSDKAVILCWLWKG